MERDTKHYHILSTLAKLPKYRLAFVNIQNTDKADDSFNYKVYLTELLNLPVSYTSKFSDTKWDFNAENPNVSPNVKGSKLAVDFKKFKNVPDHIIIEIKCLLLSVLFTPEIFIHNRRKAKKTTSKNLSTNTLISHMKAGLRFFDTLFSILNKKLGNEHVRTSLLSLTEINADDYRLAASQHPFSYNDDLKQFFSYIQNPYTSDNILGKQIPAFDSEIFQWRNRYKKQVTNQVMPNWAFDKLVRMASLLVHDFLTMMGERVSDDCVKKYAGQNTNKFCEASGITKTTFSIYRAYRLLSAGYSEHFVDTKYGIPSEPDESPRMA